MTAEHTTQKCGAAPDRPSSKFRKNLAASFLVGVLSFAAANSSWAGAWTQPVGQTYLRSSFGLYSADHYFTADGSRASGDWWDAGSTFNTTKFFQIVEYGLREDITLVFDGEFKNLSATRDSPSIRNDRVTGLGDVAAGLRYRLYNGPVIASVQGRVEIPSGYNPDRLDYALGAGEPNLDGRLQFGGGFGGPISNYWAVESGYRIRGGDFSDDWTYGAAIGMEVGPRFWGRVGVSGVENLADTEAVDVDADDVDDPTTSASYTSVGGALTFVATPTLSVEASLSTEVAGKNTFQGTGFELTFEFRR